MLPDPIRQHFLFEALRIDVDVVNLLLFSVWGAAGLPGIVKFLLRNAKTGKRGCRPGRSGVSKDRAFCRLPFGFIRPVGWRAPAGALSLAQRATP